MRRSGRGGLCSVPGAGVWCEKHVGVVCSGYGECFVRQLAAKDVCSALLGGDRKKGVMDVIRRLEEDQERMKIALPSCFGVVASYEDEGKRHVLCCHSSKMMGFGYYDGKETRTVLSEQREDKECLYYDVVLLCVC